MKKSILACLIAGCFATTSQNADAQGYVVFSNYGYNTYAPVTYGPGFGIMSGQGVDSTFTAGLYYYFGTTNVAADPCGGSVPGAFSLASVTQQFATAGPGSEGIFVGPVASIPGYYSGPITFIVIAYNGSSYANSLLRAHSASFTLASIATGATPVGEFGPGFQPFVIAIPEPSTGAILLSGVAVLFLRRKVQ
jgi:hypothetical protein